MMAVGDEHRLFVRVRNLIENIQKYSLVRIAIKAFTYWTDVAWQVRSPTRPIFPHHVDSSGLPVAI